MKKILLILSTLYFLFSCSTEINKVEQETNTSILITNNYDTDSINIKSTGHLIKDVFLILDSLDIGNYDPKPICYGNSNEIKIDTSDYGEIQRFGTNKLEESDSSLSIRGFYIDTHDYTTTKYNEEGIIKEHRFDGTSDHSFQMNYYYSNNRLDSIIIINPAVSTLISKKGEPEKWKKDLRSKILMKYRNFQSLKTLKVLGGSNNKTLYNTVYCK